MKHNTRVTTVLIAMFFITQLIGIFIVSSYINSLDLPFGMEPPEELQNEPHGFEIIIAFVFAVGLFLLLTKINAQTFIRLWYFLVTTLALGLSFNVVFAKLDLLIPMVALVVALPFAYFKIFKRNLWVHNFTELLIYPGIAAVFIPLLNVFWIVVLLFVISLYDMWAVWHAKFMQKMAEYQMNNLKIFTGFFVPYADKKQKMKIKMLRDKYKNESEEVMEKEFKKAKVKVNLAILGGGDIVFPIIAAGIFYRSFGLLSALLISICATIALSLLFVLARKGKYYPAMPFITAGIYAGMGIGYLL